MALSKLLAQMIDKNGRIAVPGFYDDVAKLSAYERKQMARVPFSEAKYKKLLGVKALFEKGFTPNNRAARPTFEINGLTSGYQGEGSKTIVPSHASAKITMRLVPHRDAAKILRLVAPLEVTLPADRTHTVELGHGPIRTSSRPPGAWPRLRSSAQVRLRPRAGVAARGWRSRS